ncbi:MAG: hypothetical protein DMG13_04690 [Acidobacteria bacterium]|nr:MAG: hypothetical protein DMG13_04690 [Acidobacteriota bacterium]
MKIRSTLALAGGFGLILSAVSAVAHHSFAAQYDRNKPVTLAGSVTKIEWINPHARFHMDVKDDSGKVVNWEVELGAPAMLMRRGWTRNSLKAGDAVTVNGFLAKDGSSLANAQTVSLSDGRKVFAGSSADGDSTP